MIFSQAHELDDFIDAVEGQVALRWAAEDKSLDHRIQQPARRYGMRDYSTAYYAGLYVASMQKRAEAVFAVFREYMPAFKVMGVSGPAEDAVRSYLKKKQSDILTTQLAAVKKLYAEWQDGIHEYPEKVVNDGMDTMRTYYKGETATLMNALKPRTQATARVSDVEAPPPEARPHVSSHRPANIDNAPTSGRGPSPIQRAMLSGLEQQREREALERRASDAEEALKSRPLTSRLERAGEESSKADPVKPTESHKLRNTLLTLMLPAVLGGFGWLYKTTNDRAYTARQQLSTSFTPILQQLATVTHPVAPLDAYPMPDTGKVLSAAKRMDSAYVSVRALLHARFAPVILSQYDSLRAETIGLMGLVDKLRFASNLPAKSMRDPKEQALYLALLNDYLRQCEKVSLRATNLQYNIISDSNR